VTNVFHLGPDELNEIWNTIFEVRRQLQQELDPDGFNVGWNDGAAAGQTVPHAHVHVIPRYAGDVSDPRGGIRWVIPSRADYWTKLP
jgi:diadenosine tetraphosphate (Ap4A) HIT family hydrolase